MISIVSDLLETACATSFSAVSLETVPVILETVCPCSFLLVSFFVLLTVALVVVTTLLPEIALPFSSLTVTTSLPAGVGTGAAPPPPPPPDAPPPADIPPPLLPPDEPLPEPFPPDAPPPVSPPEVDFFSQWAYRVVVLSKLFSVKLIFSPLLFAVYHPLKLYPIWVGSFGSTAFAPFGMVCVKVEVLFCGSKVMVIFFATGVSEESFR